MNVVNAHPKLVMLGIGLGITFAIGMVFSGEVSHQANAIEQNTIGPNTHH